MQGFYQIRFISVTALALVFHAPNCFAATGARYSWMLPKTVIDTTLVYTFDSCTDDPVKGAELHLKITPTLVARAIPDTYVGRLGVDPNDLESVMQDSSISVQTFSGSHILNSIGSAPVNQTGQIIGNILGGITKLVAVGLGVAPAAAGPPAAASKSKCGTAQATAAKIKAAQQTIKDLQTALANAPDDATQKKDTAEVQALQNLIPTLQTDLTLTIKKTIDPGFTPIDINTDSGQAQLFHNDTVTPKPIAKNGLIATFALTTEQLKAANWYQNVEDLSDTEKSLLKVNVYLDLSNAFVPIAAKANGYEQTKVSNGDLYRDVAYIPVEVWRGNKPTIVAPNNSAIPLEPVALNSAQPMAFGQFGTAQTLPLTAGTFKNLNWAITFLENGEVTNATFSSKSSGVTASTLFGTAASAANSIATEQRTATAANSEASRLAAENSTLTQEINNINLRQTLQGLNAKGLFPQ